jgi:two-component system OmpR family response regulator
VKVLLVDDEVGLTHAVSRGLRAEGYSVALAHDGISGRDAALPGGYDVVVLDIMLPGLQGYRVAEQLRSDWGTAAAKASTRQSVGLAGRRPHRR